MPDNTLNALYTAIGGLTNNSTSLNIAGNNIANISTTAFKSSTATFGDIINQSLLTGRGQIGGGSAITGINTEFNTGALIGTGNPLDMAIGGNGFFIVGAAGGTAYTRAGNFSLDNNGYLTNSQGAQLQGYMADSSGRLSSTLSSLKMDSNSLSAANTTAVSIGTDGTITAASANGQTKVIGRLAVATFANPQGLTSIGNNLYANSSTSGQPIVGTGGVGSAGSILSSTLEASNTDMASQFVDMIVSQRAFQANIKTIDSASQQMDDLLNIKA